MNTDTTVLSIDQIKIGDRYRANLGDITALARSIERIGLLHPVVINQDYELITGRRRIAAAVSLKWTEIPVRVIDLDDMLQAEHDENVFRLDFAPSEAVAIGRAIEERERTKAKERQREGGQNHFKEKDASGNFPTVSDDGRALDKVADSVGMSRKTYVRAKQVVEAAEQEPEKYKGLVEKMDSVSVNAAYMTMQRMSADGWQQQHFNVWHSFPIELNQNKYPGQLPFDLLRNVLYYTTEPGDTVIDVFGGGGNMGLVCKEMKRDCVAFDIAPKFKNIIQHDATKLFPKEYNGVASLAFLDPPYWKQKAGEYTELKNDLVNLELPEFYDALARVCRNAKRTLKPNGFLVLIIGASQFDGKYYDHALEMYALLKDSFAIVQRVTAAYPTSQYMPPQMNRATESKTMLNLRTDILFLRHNSPLILTANCAILSA